MLIGGLDSRDVRFRQTGMTSVQNSLLSLRVSRDGGYRADYKITLILFLSRPGLVVVKLA